MNRRSFLYPALRSIAAGLVLLVTALSAADAQVIRQRTNDLTTASGPPSMDDAGTFVYAPATTNQLGGNPRHEFQVFRFDAVTGASIQFSSLDRGIALSEVSQNVSPVSSVSDDGLWLAFLSSSDPLGANHDQGVELFVQRTDGTQLVQLTRDDRMNSGSVRLLDLSGDGQRIVFAWNANPLGWNPRGREQLFVIDRDGSNLRQLTFGDRPGRFGDVVIDDGGGRIVFSFTGDIPGAADGPNDDGTSEVFAIGADGTGLRQLTSDGIENSLWPDISGDGSTVVFVSTADLTGSNSKNQNEIFVIDWDGSNLTQRTSTTTIQGGEGISARPSVTDDGQVIVYFSNDKNGSVNADGNAEIFKINKDGTGETQLTDSTFSDGAFFPVISGDGTRIAFYAVEDFTGGNPDGGPEMYAMDDEGNGIVQLTTGVVGESREPDVTPDGMRIVFVSDGDLVGADSDRGGEVYVMDWDGSNLSQVTDLFTGGAGSPSISANGQTIVFSADSDPVGNNIDSSFEVFSINVNGTGLVQMSADTQGRHSRNPVIIPPGTVVFYDSNENPNGGNTDGSREIMKVQPNGSGKTQLTSGASKTQSQKPRPDETGTWVVFESNSDLTGQNTDGLFEVMRIQSNGTGLQQVTNDPDFESVDPDDSGDGSLVVFASRADLVGGNADNNFEIFLFDAVTTQTSQITSFDAGDSTNPRISGDGRYVYFVTSSPLFEPDPDQPVHIARFDRQTGLFERVGGLDRGNPDAPRVDQTGSRAVFAGIGDFTESNPDLQSEIWTIDMLGTPDGMTVESPGSTTFTWGHVAGALRYDVIRGSVSQMQDGSGARVHLGPVVCIENGSPDASTSGFDDAESPSPGEVFFYALRPDRGGMSGFEHYGLTSLGKARHAGIGNCTRTRASAQCARIQAPGGRTVAGLLPRACAEESLGALRPPGGPELPGLPRDEATGAASGDAGVTGAGVRGARSTLVPASRRRLR